MQATFGTETPKRILKTYPISPTGETWLDMPKESKVLGTTRSGGQPHVLVSQDNSQPTERRRFLTKNSGDEHHVRDNFIGNYREDPNDPMSPVRALFEGCEDD